MTRMLFSQRVSYPPPFLFSYYNGDGQRTDNSAGYKQYDTGRTYMARMGDWREDPTKEIELDGIGGVNIVVKADVHRSGMFGSE